MAIKTHKSATPGSANNKIYQIERVKVKKSAENADSKINGGIKTSNNVCDDRLTTYSIDSPNFHKFSLK